MNELLLSSNYHGASENLLAIKLSGEWREEYNSFDEYCKSRWGIPQTHVTFMIKFAHFSEMCRNGRLVIPESWTIVQDLLRKPQKNWLDMWQQCCDLLEGGPMSYDHVRMTLEHFGHLKKKYLPQHVIDSMNAKVGMKRLSSVADPSSVRGLDPELVRDGTNKAIDIDQGVMNR